MKNSRNLMFLLTIIAAILIGWLIPLPVSYAQFIDRIVRGCSSGTPTQASVIVNPNGNNNVNVTPCFGGSLTVNGVPVVPGTPAPVGATYITQIPNATLTNEQALSLLVTGILKSTTTTGVVSIAASGDIISALGYTPTNAAVVPDTAPGSGQVLIGTGTAYLPKTVSGSGATFSLSNLGVLTVSAIANASLQNSTISGISLGSNLGTLTINSPLTGVSYNGSAGVSIGCQAATGAQAGCLSATDWATFNSKQAAGSYITALTGDGTATGPGSAAFTLASVVSAGSCTACNLTIDAKGRITAKANGSSGITNAAGANVLPKSDGTNLIASRISDTGTAITIDSEAGTTTIGDVGGFANGTIILIDDANLLVRLSDSAALWANQVAPSSAGGGIIGGPTLPYGSVYIGNAATNNIQVTGTATGVRVATFPDATGTVQLVGAANTGSVLAVPVNNTVLATATGTVYSSPGNNGAALSIATEGSVSFPITRAGTIRNLYIRTGGTAKVNTPATVITIRKNGVDSTVTVTMTQTVNTTSSDTTHSFTVAAGDLITISFATTGAAAVSTSIVGVSFEID